MTVKERVTAAGVFVLALLVRIALLLQLHDVPLFRTPQLDSFEYSEWASRIAAGDFSWPETPFHGPGYPMFLGAALALTRSLFGARIVQAILGSFTVLLIFLIARRLHGLAAAIVAAVLAATYAPLAFIDVSIFGEGLLVFLLTLAANSALSRRERAAPSGAGEGSPVIHAIVAGLAFGFAVIVRPTALALTPLFLFAFRSSKKQVAIFLLLALYPIVPVMFHNWSVKGDVVAVQASGGMNFYIGNSPAHDGTAWARPGGEWDRLRGAAWRAGVRGAGGEDRYYTALAASEIASAPLRYVRLIALKLLWLIQSDEIRDSHSFQFFESQSLLLRWLPGFGVVFALAIAGLLFARHWFVAGWLLLTFAALAALVVGFRYRMPLLPPLFIFAGVGAASIARHWRIAIPVIIIGLLSTHVRRHEPSHEFSEEWAMTALALKKEGNLNDARAAARQAATMNSRSSLAWLTLGDIEATAGRWREAEAAWQRAIAADPDTARAWSHLALARINRGDMKGAEEALLRSISIRPEPEALENLAILRAEQAARR